MRTLLPAIIMIALAGFGSAAQAECPEFIRLRNEVVEATKPMNGGFVPGRCEAYIRASHAWSALRSYAYDHKEACDISSHSLGEIDRSHHDAIAARNNVCAGRPIRAFPADIILR